jgi:hypothetical protein
MSATTILVTAQEFSLQIWYKFHARPETRFTGYHNTKNRNHLESRLKMIAIFDWSSRPPLILVMMA